MGLEMKLSKGALIYVSATRGFKSGGFNPSSTAAGHGYAPEWAWSYEGGWKATLMGGRSRFATSAFVMDYTDLQVQTPIGIGVFDIRNVFYTPFNDSIQRRSPYGLLGARVEYGPSHRRWMVAAYARNVTNTDYVTGTFGTPPTAFAGRPGPSRQLAVEFTVRR
jgi:outer membrane receptor protein involved in Fe transport